MRSMSTIAAMVAVQAEGIEDAQRFLTNLTIPERGMLAQYDAGLPAVVDDATATLGAALEDLGLIVRLLNPEEEVGDADGDGD